MSRLNYKHLGYFRAVAHSGNLTQTADSLNLSQSALSVQIKKLEEQLGQQLFERKAGRLHLTEIGRVTLDHADAIFNAGDELLGALARGSAAKPVLRIGAAATLSRNFQIGLLKKLIGQTDVSISLKSGTTDGLLADLEALNLDMVILNDTVDHGVGRSLRFQKLSDQRISLIGTPGRLGAVKDLATTLRSHPFIVPSSGGSIRIGFDGLTQQYGIEPDIVAEADDMAMLRLLAREDVGVAVLPPVVVRDELQSGHLVEAHVLEEVVETFYAVTVKRQFPHSVLPVLLK